MKYCPITYERITNKENYSQKGLRLLSPQLKELKPLALNAQQQRSEAIARVGKMSIQGVQTKLSAKLKITAGEFELTDYHGHYILKPQSEYYPELPENEAITMTLAATIAIDVPVHGLLYCEDDSMTYFIKRFDRVSHRNKLAVEDFAQLLKLSRDTKYNSSMENVIKVINQFCSFPRIESVKLFKLTLFNFLVGNEDMHLKNFSLITRNKIISLSPAYDLVNTTIAQTNSREELALPLNGKKNNLTKNDFLNYFAKKFMLNDAIIANVVNEIKQALPQWKKLIKVSFLSPMMQEKYLNLLQQRCERLEL